MNRTTVIVSVIILLLAFGFAGYFLLKRKTKTEPTPAIKAVPIDAAMIMESRNLNEFFNKIQHDNKIWEELNGIGGIKSLNDRITDLRESIDTDDKLNQLFSDKSMVMSVHITGNKKLGALFLVNIDSPKLIEQAGNFLPSKLASEGVVTSKIYNNTEVFQVKPENNSTSSFTYAFCEGNFLISQSQILVEEAIRQVDTGVSVLSLKGFRKVSKTADNKADANVYINYLHFRKVIDKFINPYGDKFIHGINIFADWSEMDVDIRKDAVLLNGFAYAEESKSKFLNVFKNQEAVDLSLQKYLPDNTSLFVEIGMSNPKKYRNAYKTFLKKTGNIHKYNHHVNTVKRELDINIEDAFSTLIDNEVAVAYTDVKKPVNSDKSLVLFEVGSKKATLERLMPMLKQYANRNQMSVDDLISEHSIEEQKKTLIYRMPVLKIARKLFGNIFSRAPTNYFTFVDNVMVMARSEEALLTYLKKFHANRVLTNNKNYTGFYQSLSSESNFYLYADISRSVDFYEYFLEKTALKTFRSNKTHFSSLEALGLQFVSGSDLIYHNMYINHNPESRIYQSMQWNKKLNDKVTLKPELVVNHNTGENEIFVQDASNTVYLIDKTGEILWSRDLEGSIKSDIFQIDYYKNGNLQMLFNTEDKLHLIDRKGRDVKNYPVSLPAPASNGLSVFDYSDDKNYRIFIATEDNRVRLYDKTGKENSGWQFGTAKTPVETPVQYFRIGEKDYIVFSDNERSYILHRDGRERVEIRDNFAKSPKNRFYLQNSNGQESARLVTTDTDGHVRKIAFANGETSQIKFGEYSDEHYFKFEDMDGKGGKEYIFAEKNTLEVFSNPDSLLFNKTMKNEISLKPIAYEFSENNKKLGIVNQNNNTLLLFNGKSGEMHSKFPLKGSYLFTVGFLGKENRDFHLVAGNNNKILNYVL